MQPLEVVLFVVVSALALALIGTIVRPFLRRRRRGAVAAVRQTAAPSGGEPSPRRATGMVCPACHREYDPGLQFCPHDARDLVPANDPAARATAPGMTCPSCSRSFDATKKFCAFDGEELVPLTLAVGAGQTSAATFVKAMGKICPNCSRRYESDATFCGRDGAELVTVN